MRLLDPCEWGSYNAAVSGWSQAGILVMIVLGACSGAPKLTDDGRLVRDVNALIAGLGRAYEQRDATSLMAGVATQYPERDALRRAAEEAFGRFDRIELTLTVERIHLEGKTATVFLHWDGQWRTAAAAPVVRQGSARFVVDTDSAPALAAVAGDNPFVPGSNASR